MIIMAMTMVTMTMTTMRIRMATMMSPIMSITTKLIVAEIWHVNI